MDGLTRSVRGRPRTPRRVGHHGGPRLDGRRCATHTGVLRWEAAGWAVVGVAWVVSAWPGLLVRWSGLVFTPFLALLLLLGMGAWQVRRHHSPPTDPAAWVARRVRLAHADRRPRARAVLAVTVVLDVVVWAASGVVWCVAARAFGWSEAVTGALVQLAMGLTFLGWSALHVFAARRVVAAGRDRVVVSRRVLGCGPLTVRDDRATDPLPGRRDPGGGAWKWGVTHRRGPVTGWDGGSP